MESVPACGREVVILRSNPYLSGVIWSQSHNFFHYSHLLSFCFPTASKHAYVDELELVYLIEYEKDDNGGREVQLHAMDQIF